MGEGEGESEYVKLLYVLVEHRIQNSEYRIQKLMYIKLPMYLFFIWRSTFLNTNGTRFARCHFWAKKKYRSSGHTPSTGPRNWCCSHKNHYIPCHINNRFINSYYLSQDPSWWKVSFLKGTYNFQNCFRRQFVKVHIIQHMLQKMLILSFLDQSIKNLTRKVIWS